MLLFSFISITFKGVYSFKLTDIVTPMIIITDSTQILLYIANCFILFLD